MALPNPLGDNDSSQMQLASGAGGHLALVGYIMEKVKHARDVRDQNYATRWKEYTRLWRGLWSSDDKNQDSERSRLIAPALSQAIDTTVAEMEEALFGQTAWFDITDDIDDENKEDALEYRDRLLEDFKLQKVPNAVIQVILLGAIYGTGIGKINVEKKEVTEYVEGKYVTRQRVVVTLHAIRPDEFVIDPSACTVEEAEFCAHELFRPVHLIQEKQADGVYKKDVDVSSWSGTGGDPSGTGTTSIYTAQDGAALVTEYYGKVPKYMLEDKEYNDDADETLVEALVTIVNEGDILRAVANPYTMNDRPIIAYPHETIPGEFWGRGVSEKGYNPQKALDAELRARIDALAYMTAPILGADITRMPRNPDMRVRPGKVFYTRGRPSEILEPIGFSANLNNTFQQSGDLERMVQMGTGAMDSQTPTGISRRNETLGGMSMMQSNFIKRSKLTMQNLESLFIEPLITKSLWRYMQFEPEKYPVDMKFSVNSTMGTMAKEAENAQLVGMLGYVPPESPAHTLIVKALFENTTSARKRDLMQALSAMTEQPSEEQQQLQQMQQQMQLKGAQLALQQQELQNAELQANIALIQAKTKHELVETELEDDMVEIQAANAATAAEKARVARRQTEVAQQRNIIQANQRPRGTRQ